MIALKQLVGTAQKEILAAAIYILGAFENE